MYKRLLLVIVCIGITVLVFMLSTILNNNRLERVKKEVAISKNESSKQGGWQQTGNLNMKEYITNNPESGNNNVYEYVDAHGNLVVTNKPTENARKMHLPPLAVYARPMTEKDLYSDGYTASLSGAQNKIDITGAWLHKDEDIPNINDTGRRIILTEELEHEKNALVSSTASLEYAKQNRLKNENDMSYQNRLQTLADNVKAHQKNIELLMKILN